MSKTAEPPAATIEPSEFAALPDDAGPNERLTAALAAAQAEFPTIPKSQTATVQGKDGKAGYSYRYADVGDVLGLVRPVLARHGLALTQRTRHRADNGKVELITELRHVAGGHVTSEIEIGQAPSAPQQFGSALTYLRRYELVTLLGIAAEEDRDAQDVPAAGERQQQAPPYGRAVSQRIARDASAALIAICDGRTDVAEQRWAQIKQQLGGYMPHAVAIALVAAAGPIAAPEPDPEQQKDQPVDQPPSDAEPPDPDPDPQPAPTNPGGAIDPADPDDEPTEPAELYEPATDDPDGGAA